MICLVYIVNFFIFFSTVAAYMANKVVYIICKNSPLDRDKVYTQGRLLVIIYDVWLLSRTVFAWQPCVVVRTKLKTRDKIHDESANESFVFIGIIFASHEHPTLYSFVM